MTGAGTKSVQTCTHQLDAAVLLELDAAVLLGMASVPGYAHLFTEADLEALGQAAREAAPPDEPGTRRQLLSEGAQRWGLPTAVLLWERLARSGLPEALARFAEELPAIAVQVGGGMTRNLDLLDFTADYAIARLYRCALDDPQALAETLRDATTGGIRRGTTGGVSLLQLLEDVCGYVVMVGTPESVPMMELSSIEEFAAALLALQAIAPAMSSTAAVLERAAQAELLAAAEPLPPPLRHRDRHTAPHRRTDDIRHSIAAPRPGPAAGVTPAAG